MALCFALESIGVWSIYSPINADSLMVAVYIFVLVFSFTFMKDFKDVAGGNQLKDRMILALTVPNFTILLVKMVISL